EAFRPDQFGGADETDRLAERPALARIFEPEIGDGRRTIGRSEDDVECRIAPGDLAEPALILYSDLVAQLLEQRQNARPVAGLAEYVEVLGLARDSGVCTDRERACDQKGNLCFGNASNCFGIERFLFGSSKDGLGT